MIAANAPLTFSSFSNCPFTGRIAIMLETEIRKVFSEYPDIIYGLTDIFYCSYKESYRSALIFAVPYGEQLSPDN